MVPAALDSGATGTGMVSRKQPADRPPPFLVSAAVRVCEVRW